MKIICRWLNCRVFYVFLWLCLLAGCTSLDPSHETLIFSATGDGPLSNLDWTLLPKYFDLEKADGRSEFLLHVGDITSQCLTLPESYYIKVAKLYQSCPIPVIFVPGDNEWNDLENPDEGWLYWERHFLSFEKNFKSHPQIRHQPVRQENIAWISKGVLLIGINLVGGMVHDEAEWKLRHQQNADWIRENFEGYGRQVRAVVVFAQARPSILLHEDFFSPFVESARLFRKPVLYLHGDGHYWDYEPAWRAENILRVMVDQVTKAPPVLITVTLDLEQPFIFDRRLEQK